MVNPTMKFLPHSAAITIRTISPLFQCYLVVCSVCDIYHTRGQEREILGTRLIPHTTHYSSDEGLLLDTSLFVRVTTASLLKCLAELGVRSYTRWCLLSGLSALVYNKGLSGVVNNDYDTLRVMYFKYRSRFALLVSAECSLKK